MRCVVRPDHDGHKVRPGKERLGLGGSQRLDRSWQLVSREVRRARSGPAVADDVHGAVLGLGHPACNEVRESVLGSLDAHAGRRGVAENDQPQPAPTGPGVALRWDDDVVDIEARMGGQELHAAKPHELHRGHTGKGADGRAEHTGNPRQPAIHAFTLPSPSA